MPILDITLFFYKHKLLIKKIITRVLLIGLTTAGVIAIVIGIIRRDDGMIIVPAFGVGIVWIIAGRIRVHRYNTKMRNMNPLERRRYRRWPFG